MVFTTYHILADLGIIPTVEQYFKNMEIQPWMSGTLKKRRTIKFNKISDTPLED